MSREQAWIVTVTGGGHNKRNEFIYRVISQLVFKEEETAAKASVHGIFIKEFPDMEVQSITVCNVTKSVRGWVADNPTLH